MAKYNSSNITVKLDNSSGSLVDMSAYVSTMSAFSVEGGMIESHTFGDSWAESLPTGIRSAGTIELGGTYDDTSTSGPDAIFNAPAATTATSSRTLEITWGGSKTSTVEVFITSYQRTASRGDLTTFSVTLQTTGAVTEA